jgi:hypothetical protein
MNTDHPIVDIELLFLDLNTCARCQGTDANLDAAVDQVRRELEAQGLTVRLQRRHVTSEAEALALGFEISPTIRVNGRDIQLDWHASPCAPCTQLAGSHEAVDCRIWQWQGEEHASAPVAMIAEAIRQAVAEPTTPGQDARPERLTEPLRRFFSGTGESNACCKHPGETTMKTLEVFDPAMCCSTGVCGVDVDPVLAQFAADLKWVEAHGITVARHNLGQEPQAFAANPAVVKEMEAGMDRLPILAVDGHIVSTGMYPSRQQLAQKLGITLTTAEKPRLRVDSGCSPKSGCC